MHGFARSSLRTLCTTAARLPVSIGMVVLTLVASPACDQGDKDAFPGSALPLSFQHCLNCEGSHGPADPTAPEIPGGPDDFEPVDLESGEGNPRDPEDDGGILPLVGRPFGSRIAQWPLKTQRRLRTQAQINQARLLSMVEPDAITVKGNILLRADYWLTVPDEQLYSIIPDHRVPRAVDVSASSDGCPVHGTSIFAHGTYPWILDQEHPYQIKCPVGQETYPSNDFISYYAGGMDDPALLTGPYADNGHGWQAPNGKRYWFVAYACHWHWRQTWVPGLEALARAYVLTGNRNYARKALVILDRIATAYPDMDYNTQSRDSRKGKIVNAFWESWLIRDIAIAYDSVFETLIGSDPVGLPWRPAHELRENIEPNILEEAFDAYESTNIDGNYGTHQSALAHVAVVRDCPQATDEMIERVFRRTATLGRYEGFDYALHNLVFKDGLPYETSPSYNSYWVTSFGLIAEVAPLAGIDPFGYARMPRIFDAPLDLLCAGQFTPNNGDCGNIYTQAALPHVDAYETAYRAIGGPSYAWTLLERGALTDSPYGTYNKLFIENIDAQGTIDAGLYDPVRQSRVLDGYGMAILNNAADSVAVSLYYGIHGNHGHNDRLNIELFAHGSRVSPDLGYPDFANSTTPGRFAWTSNTVSHNTVMVDGGPQTGNDRGNVLRFHRGDQVSVVDVDAATSYPQTTKYRRQLVLVEAGDDAYLVDVFRVAGGGNHVLSLHGHEGTFSLTGPTLSAVNTQGTLAGSNVPYGTNSGMPSGPPNYNSFFSGYSFMYNWQTAAHTGNVATATWNHADGNMLRVHLGPNAGQELVVTDARVSPLLKIPAIFKYLLVRRPGDANGTTFTSVWELTDNPIATGPVTVTTGAGSGADRTVIVKVPRGSVTDTIAVAPQPGNVFTIEAGLTSNAAVTMLSRSGLTLTRSFVAGGSTVAGTQNISVPATLSGTIATANYATKTITANLGASTVNAASLVGKSVRIYNPMHSSLWTIGAATRTGAVLTLTLDGAEVFNGRIKPTMIETHANENVYDVLTNTSMLYPEDMPGMYLVTLDLAAASRIQTTYSVNRYGLGAGANFAPYAAAIANGEDLWIADFGVGDTIEIERFTQSGS